jgi:ribulose-5-phosphate 4-epimerase/fuculose-1-phosphate aldolase
VLNGANIRDFYLNNEPADFENAETSGSECTKANVVPVEGLAVLRPSVEAGFHSILKTFVLHTHSVYANLAACTVGGREVAAKALIDADYSWGWVDYQDPGAMLAFSIRDELRRVEAETGKVPSVIIMQNHGIIVHDDDAVSCLAIHADANVRLAAHYGLAENAFPRVTIDELAGGVYRASTPYLKEHDVFLLQNHGALTVGCDLITAYYRMETLELFAKISLTAHLLGGAQEIEKPQIDKLLDLRENYYKVTGKHPGYKRYNK